MAMPADFGYMEEGQLGRPYNMRLLGRLIAYLRPAKGLIVGAAVLVLIGTALNLALPYVTKTAIDGHIVRQALAVRPEKAAPDLAPDMAALNALGLLDAGGESFVAEAALRELDPRQSARLRAAGVIGAEPYYIAAAGPHAEQAARARPELFARGQDVWLIRAADLTKLPEAELKQLRGPDAHGLILLGALFAGLALGGLVVEYVQSMLLERAGQIMTFDLRQELYAHVLGRSSAFFSRNPLGKLVTRLTNDVQNINEMFRSTLVSLIQDMFLLVGIMATLFFLDVSLALVCLALTPLIAIMAWIFARQAREAFRQLQGHLGRINSWLSETMGGLAVVKLLGAEAAGARRFQRLNEQYFQAGMRQIKVFAVFMPLAELFSSLAVALILWHGGGQVIQDRLSLGALVAFLSYMQMFFRPVRDLAEKYNILQAAMASGERIFMLLDDDDALPEPAQQLSEAPGPGEARFRDVSFGYDPARPVVKNVDFVIPAGQSWAVVGPTGAGKTSLTALLMRFYDPQSGAVEIDGVDLRRMSRRDIARRVAMAPQEVIILSGSIADNVIMGREDVGPAELRQALEISGAATFVDELPDGARTILGEGGRQLSAGQRQLLSLARALAGQPRVLVLDEATSSVDPASERLIQQALPRIMAGRTSLVVAHRLSTVRHADNILVMQRGRVVEQGTHEQLAAAGGLYARLARLEEIKAKGGA